MGCSEKPSVYFEYDGLRSVPLLGYSSEFGYGPVWLAEDVLFFPSGSVPNFKGGSVYDLHNDELQILQLELSLNCFQGNFNNWSRLPNGRLGFIYECRDESLSLVAYYLIEWDSQTDQYETLFKYSGESLVGQAEEYAVTEDLDRVIQEATGGSIRHQLYSISLEDNEIVPLFSEFYRSGSPSWSPDGQQLVFAGNEAGPSALESIFAGYRSLRNEIYLPWNLYVVDRKGENVQEILSGIRFVDTIKWSPVDEALIAFRGAYKDTLGLWVFNLKNDSLTFLWPEGDRRKVRFDWSPDGTQLVVLDCKSTREDEVSASCRPIIITLPQH